MRHHLVHQFQLEPLSCAMVLAAYELACNASITRTVSSICKGLLGLSAIAEVSFTMSSHSSLALEHIAPCLFANSVCRSPSVSVSLLSTSARFSLTGSFVPVGCGRSIKPAVASLAVCPKVTFDLGRLVLGIRASGPKFCGAIVAASILGNLADCLGLSSQSSSSLLENGLVILGSLELMAKAPLTAVRLHIRMSAEVKV